MHISAICSPIARATSRIDSVSSSIPSHIYECGASLPPHVGNNTRHSLYGFPTLDRLGASDCGTLRSTLRRTNPTIAAPKRVKPIFRDPTDQPPVARTGASRLSQTFTLHSPVFNDDIDEVESIQYTQQKQCNLWARFAQVLTCCVFPGLLKYCGKHSKVAQQAWREKIALCFIIFILCGAVGFLTFGLEPTFCPPQNEDTVPYFNKTSNGSLLQSVFLENKIVVRGYAYNSTLLLGVLDKHTSADFETMNLRSFTNLNSFFELDSGCEAYGLPNDCSNKTCAGEDAVELVYRQRLVISWEDIENYNESNERSLVALGGMVLNISEVLQRPGSLNAILNGTRSNDITLQALQEVSTLEYVRCLQQLYGIGFVAVETTGCIASATIQAVSLAVILSLVFTKFFMALYFYWRVAPSLAKEGNVTRCHIQHVLPTTTSGAAFDSTPHTLMLVTCYSESRESLRATLDSLAHSEYPDERKMLFVVADGLVTGSGNDESTPDIVLDLIDLDRRLPYPEPASYLAIADGPRQHNMGYVYSGHYRVDGLAVPTIVIVKCGTVSERLSAKPGNRGKRDSQLILMNFLSRCLFNDRMTRLDYEVQYRIIHLMGIHPSTFEYVLMVDADTDVHKDAIKHMITAMLNDRNIMGLCGETRIRNKWASWVTAMQVFEYYSSHHLGKAFESIFGGVTCLPGCFSMYRVKIPKDMSGNFVPLLVNPDVVQEYSENVVETLHKKNLLLLGEDRFLSTLMLRNFPRRKMMFVPQAICHTVVPDEFKVLLSQRRRWINSTVHNLLELLLVKDLCGNFCFSMQFVVFVSLAIQSELVELVGTVVLPAAISFTIFLLIQTAITGQVQLVPMLLLTIYIWWLCVYIVLLPLWNFVLPLYAFWHFDDFSWGQTRMVHGEAKGGDKEGHGGSTGEETFDLRSVQLKTSPGSHLTAFLVLHELTAVLPLPILYYSLRATELQVPVPQTVMEKAEIAMDKVIRRYGWSDGPAVNDDGGVVVAKTRMLVDLATAYAIVKLLMPVRLGVSALLTP
ncbi:hypothetical protein HDU82_005949, partial [Entophlyctis luteolus]